MNRKQLWKTGCSILMAAAMVLTSVPATAFAAVGTGSADLQDAESESIVATALASYDFNDYYAPQGATDQLQEKEGNTVITLEAKGGCKAPELVEDEKRGTVLSLTEQGTGDDGVATRGDALLPENPFAEKSVDNGFTVSFWTKTTGKVAGNRCLMDFEVAPATGGRAGTFAINQSMVYWNVTDQAAGVFTDFNIGNMNLDAENGWIMVTMTVTTDGIAFYRNGEKISHSVNAGAEDYATMIDDLAGGRIEDPTQTNVRLGASMAKYWIGAGALMDDISFYGKALSADEIAALYQETLVPVDLESVTVSGSNSVFEGSGTQLTAELTPADTTVDRTVTWKSSDPETVDVDENGVATGLKKGTASVTATVAGIESKPFEITVESVIKELEEGYYLTVYSTTTPFYAQAGNLEQETQSVYMAVSKDGKTFDVLNNGGGVIFSKNTSGTLAITEPRIYKEDDVFTVVAPDADAEKGIHVFTSKDGVNYYDDTIITENDRDTTPLYKESFSLLLDEKNILETDKNITLGNALSLTEEEYKYIVDKLGTVVNTGLDKKDQGTLTVQAGQGLTEAELSANFPSVNATYSDGSTQKFNIDWSGALAGIDLTKAGTYSITGKVDQTKYLNNLKALNGSTLPEDDPENVGDEADNYDEETGKVYYDATKFVEGMADPNIYWDEQTGYYYMTGSYFPEDGDKIDPNDNTQSYDRVVLRRARTLEGLQDRSTQVTIWKAGNQGFEDGDGTPASSGYRYIWAPELHRVGDHWVVYFTESHKGDKLYNIYCHALILDGTKDPYETALTYSAEASQWEDYKMRSNQASDPFNTEFCLDMTYFKDEKNGKSYVIWAGKPTKAYKGANTDLFIATVDEAKPWEITSTATRVTKADYGWERVRFCVNEGATVLQKDGKIFMAYSSSGTGSEYAIGMCTAAGGADLLDEASWTKSPYPVLTSRDVDGEEGPGHNSFTVDKDGNVIFVYHARPTSHNYEHCGWDGQKSSYNKEPLEDPCRHARLKRVHWAADGMPILKMTYEEELTEANSTVTATVVVTGTTSDGGGNNGGTNNGGGTPAPGDGGQTTQPSKVSVDSVKLNKSKVTLGVKEKFTLTAEIAPANATDQAITWKSSNSKVAAVSAKGVVTAKKKGTATITATADGKSVSCKVTVKAAPKKITLNAKSKSIKAGKTFKIKVKLPKNTASNKITYTSSNKKVATVSAAGQVKGVKKGKATITVKTFNGKKAKLKITVKK